MDPPCGPFRFVCDCELLALSRRQQSRAGTGMNHAARQLPKIPPQLPNSGGSSPRNGKGFTQCAILRCYNKGSDLLVCECAYSLLCNPRISILPDSASSRSDPVQLLGKLPGSVENASGAGKKNRDHGEARSKRVLPLSPATPPGLSGRLHAKQPQVDPGQSVAIKRRPRPFFLMRREASSFLASAVFHCMLLLVLGLVAEVSRPEPALHGELVAHIDRPLTLESAVDTHHREPASLNPKLTLGLLQDEPRHLANVDNPSLDILYPVPSLPRVSRLQPTAHTDWLQCTDTDVAGALDGRTADARARLVRGGGGNDRSEKAVEMGLRWLMAHQREDGSWHFNHQNGLCQGRCRNPGTAASTTGATALALLPMLGAGYTHQQGEYSDVVRRGLYYLGNRTILTADGADLRDGTMYAQGLAAIALCEAYAMTADPALKDIAQAAIDFIVYAQDKKGGGWRYTPGEPGDTTVTGWQLMALKSGQMANLNVPSPTIFLAKKFLTSVQCENGARYGYMNTTPRNTTTAIGLLCRMYTGWQRNNLTLRQGVVYHLSEWGPSNNNMYYNYYATQVMHHWGGPEWDRWNRAMRDYLIATQATSGHEAGSWYFGGGYGQVGGRLYNTAMAVMTLEVYYRFMPLYRRDSFGGYK